MGLLVDWDIQVISHTEFTEARRFEEFSRSEILCENLRFKNKPVLRASVYSV